MSEPGPGIVLVGMPASGKSTVGQLVAQRLDRPFVDTDELVAARTGMQMADLIRVQGEPAARAEESKAVEEACAVPGAVISTGGGAVLDPLNRWALWHHGTVAWLDISGDELLRRVATDDIARPTLEPYGAERLATVLAERAPAYRAADHRLDASGAPDVLADDLVSHVGPIRGRRLLEADVERHHPIGPANARVVMGVDLAGESPAGIAIVDRRLLTAAPELVRALRVTGCLPVAAGERAKRLRTLERILEWLAAERVERETPLIAVGGGTIGDLAGTAAALYARGLPLVHVPTTWLAQADSAFGGKVAVDLSGSKNAVGAFWPPMAVVSDVAALRSLPVRLRRDGMAESIKAAIIGDVALWRLLEERGADALRTDEPARYAILERSARLKLGVCERDPFETGERRTLNLGHTLGHALEIESRYRLPHGAAVALGMRAVAAIAASRGADPELAPRLDVLLDWLGFALRRPFDPAAVRSAMLGDKKRHAGRQRWILPMEIGRVVEADDVTDAELELGLKTIAA
ncbi:MAG: shikimate kinase / 3-dehydroquinate synthase [Chloroflexota bacterium]|jgi:3-dehydroquinate synthetase/shikimate kinase|nr:shikimate kinase / 3-dehydroquinate synthase [Chloroflexota bacterium]